MRSVMSGFAGSGAAREENCGTEASAAPTALAPVTVRNSRRFSIGTSRLAESTEQKWRQSAIIQSTSGGVKQESWRI
jgi:hypothetical protein